MSSRYFALQLETVESPMYAKAITRQSGISSRITTGWVSLGCPAGVRSWSVYQRLAASVRGMRAATAGP